MDLNDLLGGSRGPRNVKSPEAKAKDAAFSAKLLASHPFKLGDVACLKSISSPTMVVSNAAYGESNVPTDLEVDGMHLEAMVTVAWFDDNRCLHQTTLPAKLVQKVGG